MFVPVQFTFGSPVQLKHSKVYYTLYSVILIVIAIGSVLSFYLPLDRYSKNYNMLFNCYRYEGEANQGYPSGPSGPSDGYRY